MGTLSYITWVSPYKGPSKIGKGGRVGDNGYGTTFRGMWVTNFEDGKQEPRAETGRQKSKETDSP